MVFITEKRTYLYQDNIVSVKFTPVGTKEDDLKVLECIILNHLRKMELLAQKNNIDNSRSIFELTK